VEQLAEEAVQPAGMGMVVIARPVVVIVMIVIARPVVVIVVVAHSLRMLMVVVLMCVCGRRRVAVALLGLGMRVIVIVRCVGMVVRRRVGFVHSGHSYIGIARRASRPGRAGRTVYAMSSVLVCRLCERTINIKNDTAVS
jgi:hypothetical protein